MFYMFMSNKAIAKEVENYLELGFFKKSKNILVLFIFFSTFISFMFADDIGLDNDIHTWVAIFIHLTIAGFIYLNHRWAVVLFAILFTADKIIFISEGVPVIPQLIFGLLVLGISYTTFRVATGLRSAKKADTGDMGDN